MVSFSSFLALFYCTFAEFTYILNSTVVSRNLGPIVLITMMNMDITSKSAYKLLQQLESDPQLQSIKDTTIFNDEQHPISFESSITNLKDMIPLVSAVTILRWNADTCQNIGAMG